MNDNHPPNLPRTRPSRHVTRTSHARTRMSHPYAPTHHMHAPTHRALTHSGTYAHHLRPRAFASPPRVLMRFLPLRGNFFIRKKTSKKNLEFPNKPPYIRKVIGTNRDIKTITSCKTHHNTLQLSSIALKFTDSTQYVVLLSGTTSPVTSRCSWSSSLSRSN